MEHLPRYEFQKCVTRYRGDYQQKSFSCWDQFLAMGFAQFTYRESLRDIEACLRSVSGKLYHMGFRGKVARTTLAEANESHDWRIFADFAQVLIAVARPLYARDPIGVDLDAAFTRWTPPPLTSVFRCSRGRVFASTRPPSNCTRCWTSMAISQRLLALQTERCPMSECSTRSFRRPARST